MEKVKNGKKNTIKHIYNVIYEDCRSTTGNNLRNILLLSDKSHIDQLIPYDALQIRYKHIDKNDEWKIQYINDIIETLNAKMEIPGFEENELKEMLNYLCIS